MKIALLVVGLLVILLGGFLIYNPQPLSSLGGYAGLSSSQVTYDHSSFVRVGVSNYSSIPVTITPQDTLNVRIQSDSPGVNFLVMNYGNFSELKSGNSNSYSVYPQSRLNVQNYSFSMTQPSSSESYYLVFFDPATNTTSSALVHLTIVTKGSLHVSEYIPAIIVAVGLAILGIGTLTGRKSPKIVHKEPPPLAKTVSSPTTPSTAPSPGLCRYCGAPLKPDSPFCPSCQKSQI